MTPERQDETVVEPAPRAPTHTAAMAYRHTGRRLADQPMWYLVLDRFGAPVALLAGVAYFFFTYAGWAREDAAHAREDTKAERASYVEAINKNTEELRQIRAAVEEVRRSQRR